MLICVVAAPAVALFYREPRLTAIMFALSTTFFFTGLAAQHRAVLLRSVRIPILAAIDIATHVISIAIAIGMAAAGLSYWALGAPAEKRGARGRLARAGRP